MKNAPIYRLFESPKCTIVLEEDGIGNIVLRAQVGRHENVLRFGANNAVSIGQALMECGKQLKARKSKLTVVK